MKREFVFIMSVLFMISFCYAIPQISIQKSNYVPSETVLGTISGVEGGLTRDSLQIFEGKREVSFEKDVALIEGNYYFYIIPPKEGNYDLKISNVLYRENGVLKSVDLDQVFNVSQKLDANNKTYGLTIRPGFYAGYTPVISLTNNGQEDLNISYENSSISLAAGETQKVYPQEEGFFIFNVSSYDSFQIPVYNLNNIVNASTITNISQWNASLEVPINLSLSLLKDTEQNFSITLRNFGSSTYVSFQTDLDFVNLTSYDSQIDQDQTKNFVLNFNASEVGAYTGKIEYYVNNTKINETRLDLYIFSNLTSLNTFQQIVNNASTNPSPQTCDEMGMFSCDDNQNCPTDSFSYDFVTKKKCCSVQCVTVGSSTSSTGILIGIIALVVVGGAGYYLYRRMKKFRGLKPEEQFKKVVAQYDKKSIGK